MNIINIEHISKVYGEKVIFDDASYGIQEGDKIGIIGINGTGKTTLLNMIAGREETDSGSIIRQNGLHMAYLSQNPAYEKEDTVLSFVTRGIDPSDWTAISEAKSNLMTLGLTNYEEKLEHLSGGQRKKAALAKVLLGSFDVLILDEPTNHLDGSMLEWLEDYLRRFRGTVIMVTHDRYFLDRTSNRILEISHGKIYGYEANYSQFLELKAQREEMELASELKRPEHPSDGAGMGKARLSGTDDKAAGATGSPGGTEERYRTGDGCSRGDGFGRDTDGQKDGRAASCDKAVWGAHTL